MLPNQFLLLADQLLKTQQHQAGLRTAVSRAYYAAHHHVKAFVESAGVAVRKGGEAHADVWYHLAGIGDAELEGVGNELAQLHSDRNEADYDLHRTQFERKANATDRVTQARELMDAVDRCRADTPRYEQVKAAIKRRNAVLRGLTPKP